MVGKLTKIAQGLPITHAGRGEVDRSLVAAAAAEAGAPRDLVSEIGTAVTARFAAERLHALGLAVPFHRALAASAIRSLRRLYPGPHQLCILAAGLDGRLIVQAEEDELV